jgi:hypothetical protein
MNGNFAVGNYINLYDEEKELWVIINEANDELSNEEILEAEDIMGKYFDKMELRKMRKELEEIFGFGVQIFINQLNSNG